MEVAIASLREAAPTRRYANARDRSYPEPAPFAERLVEKGIAVILQAINYTP
ncbi:MAG: hypothetical protein ACYT04_39020 [Nostoc sp.]